MCISLGVTRRRRSSSRRKRERRSWKRKRKKRGRGGKRGRKCGGRSERGGRWRRRKEGGEEVEEKRESRRGGGGSIPKIVNIWNSCIHRMLNDSWYNIYVVFSREKMVTKIQTFWVRERKNKLVLWQFWNGTGLASLFCALTDRALFVQCLSQCCCIVLLQYLGPQHLK